MPIYQLHAQPLFPDPRFANPSGLLAVGGDLSIERLTLAYRQGIFPWFSEDQPLLWWSPDPRMVLFLDELYVGRSLRKRLRKRPYKITFDRAFDDVIGACAAIPRPGQGGTWITDRMQEAYRALHRAGIAHSVEAWSPDGALVGGLYGVNTGRCFAGESMFAKADDASKISFVHLCLQLQRWGVGLVDCQMHTEHLARFGAREIPRQHFLQLLEGLVEHPPPSLPWRFDPDVLEDLDRSSPAPPG
ncbi:MAG: leucyl/phenylalanyl-tRNA--protein transferase [Deltaproteobacteria bacterium]|nr:MAG: leucyl/phenylalanyl-tRNA--protein transferase [Deltaproteobacteria bacterium]